VSGTPDTIARQRAEDDERVRQQNWFRGSDVQDWREFELRWRTRRWWPREDGWGWIAIAMIPWFLMPVAVVNGSLRFATILGFAGWSALFLLVTVATHNFDTESAVWRLRVSPSAIRIEKQGPDRYVDVREIERLEAGALDIRIEDRKGSRGSRYLVLASAAGWSVDRRVAIVLPGRRIHTGPGLFDRVELARIIIGWWPVNHRSRQALAEYERRGYMYWRPFGLVPGRRVTHSGEDD
jgi:hypothetical protein